MKTVKVVATLIVFVSLLCSVTGCRTTRTSAQYPKAMIIQPNPSGKIPPGQMKKVTGATSAKEYAPGQNKGKGKKKK